MTRQDSILELYKQGSGYTAIGKKVGLSRQRVFQIVKNYRNTGKKGRSTEIKKLYENLGICRECNQEKATVLHHEDFNNSNDNIENLSPVCIGCHGELHIGRKREIFKKELTMNMKVLSALISEKEYNFIKKIAYVKNVSKAKVLREILQVAIKNSTLK